MIESWEATTTEAGSRLVVYVDEKNPLRDEYRKLPTPEGVEIFYGLYRTMVQVVNFLSCERYPGADFYSECNDDHVFRTPGWDEIMMDAAERHNNGAAIVYGKTQNLPTATLHGGKIVRHLGYFFPPCFAHSWVDNWLMLLGVKARLLVHVPEVFVEHMHPAFGKAEKDQTYQIVEAGYAEGRVAFEKWRREQSEKDISGVLSMIRGLKVVKPEEKFAIHEPVSVMMTTHDRLNLLDRTITSYINTDSRPARLFVFDDASKDSKSVETILARIPESVLIRFHDNAGCALHHLRALRWMFDSGARKVLVLDSDCLFVDKWYETAQQMAGRDDLVSLFNSKLHPGVPIIGNLVLKKDIGGLGMMLPRAMWDGYLKDEIPERDTNWDCLLCRKLEHDGKPVYACSPSLLQHIGDGLGMHQNIGNVAEDFPGESYANKFTENHTTRLRYIGDTPYRGFDDNGNTSFECNTMEVVFVSQEKGDQLLRDFPNQFVFVGSTDEERAW
jgi:hypothetical protein